MTNSNCKSLRRSNSTLNAESKHCSSNFSKPLYRRYHWHKHRASNSFPREAKLCLAGMAGSTLPGSLQELQEEESCIQTPLCRQTPSMQPGPGSRNFGNSSCKQPRWQHLLGGSGTQQWTEVLHGSTHPCTYLAPQPSFKCICNYLSAEVLIFFTLFTSILLNSLMPADHYRNQYLIICSIMHPFHGLSSKDQLPATGI